MNSSHPAPTPRPILQLGCNQLSTLLTNTSNKIINDPGDQVNAEAQAWARLPEAGVALHRNSLDLIEEFALMSPLKKKFPLHYMYTVFRQSSSHLTEGEHPLDSRKFSTLGRCWICSKLISKPPSKLYFGFKKLMIFARHPTASRLPPDSPAS